MKNMIEIQKIHILNIIRCSIFIIQCTHIYYKTKHNTQILNKKMYVLKKVKVIVHTYYFMHDKIKYYTTNGFNIVRLLSVFN